MQIQSPETFCGPERSADEISHWIVEELARLQKIVDSAIDTTAPLDSLGVDSLSALGLVGSLSMWLNRDLPATLMWDYSSIDAIAEALANVDNNEIELPGIVKFQTQGANRAVFVFPGVGGHPITFTTLAAHLGNSQPCYGLIVPGLDGESEPLTRVEDIAAVMVENLRRVQPNGPYQLAGYSFGGLLAFEAACQLVAAGEKVSMLALYDAFAPEGRVSRPAWQRMIVHGYCLLARPNRMHYFRDRIQRLRGPDQTAMNETLIESGAKGELQESAAKLVVAANHRAFVSYVPGHFAGDIVLFRAMEPNRHDIFYKPARYGGWDYHAAHVEVVRLPGNHMTILDPTRSPGAAIQLKPYLHEMAWESAQERPAISASTPSSANFRGDRQLSQA